MKKDKLTGFLTLESSELAKCSGGKRQNTDVTPAGIVNSSTGKDDYFDDKNSNNKLDRGECLHFNEG